MTNLKEYGIVAFMFTFIASVDGLFLFVVS
jgi:hypothetical protein